MTPLSKRYDILFLYDVVKGNPNGDPAAAGTPRVCSTSGKGLGSDVFIKRHMRNFISMAQNETYGFEMFIKDKAILNDQIKRGDENPTDTSTDTTTGKLTKAQKKDLKQAQIQKKLCSMFYDVRTMGAVLSTGDVPAGTITGPFQVTFSDSIHPIFPQEHTITRCCATSNTEDKEKERTMGVKHTIPYALYQGYAFVNVFQAHKTGFSQEDLTLTLQAMMNMFEYTRSASRGMITMREIIVFEHESKLGNDRAALLFERVKITSTVEVPEKYSDYTIQIDQTDLPKGIRVLEVLLDGSLQEIPDFRAVLETTE